MPKRYRYTTGIARIKKCQPKRAQKQTEDPVGSGRIQESLWHPSDSKHSLPATEAIERTSLDPQRS